MIQIKFKFNSNLILISNFPKSPKSIQKVPEVSKSKSKKVNQQTNSVQDIWFVMSSLWKEKYIVWILELFKYDF